MNGTDSARRGFTVVELLVVVAIIGLLIGLAIPALGAARGRARTVACLANVRSVTTGLNTFTADHGGRLPANRTLVSDDEHVTWRHGFLESGLVTPETMVCPARVVDPKSELGLTDNGTLCVGDLASNYALNGHVVWTDDLEARDEDRSDVVIGRPSHTLIVTETRAHYPDLRATNQLISEADETFGTWHAGRGAYGFLDGHAETFGLFDTGNPDCRWHNGADFDTDVFADDDPELSRQHGHPDWVYLLENG